MWRNSGTKSWFLRDRTYITTKKTGFLIVIGGMGAGLFNLFATFKIVGEPAPTGITAIYSRIKSPAGGCLPIDLSAARISIALSRFKTNKDCGQSD